MCSVDVVQPVEYTCHRAPWPLDVDGTDRDVAWRYAPWFDQFVDIVTGKAPWFASKSALLWNSDYLYVAFDLEEPQVEATLATRDAQLFLENDVELFIAGANAYYELEINALNTIYEVLWVWEDALQPRGVYDGHADLNPATRRTTHLAGIGGHVHPRGWRIGFLDWDLDGLVHSVRIDGTLNDPEDRDMGWRVDLAIPWKSLALLADHRSLPPQPGDTWSIECSRFQHRRADGGLLAQSVGWTWSPHGHYDSHIPECFPHINFSAAPLRVPSRGREGSPR